MLQAENVFIINDYKHFIFVTWINEGYVHHWMWQKITTFCTHIANEHTGAKEWTMVSWKYRRVYILQPHYRLIS